MSDKIFGTYTTNNRDKIRTKVNLILSLESKYKNMTDEELKKMTNVFRDKLSKGSSLEDIMIDAFAVVREATSRTLNMAHYPVQLEAAIAMQEKVVTEMKTGEGKTLVQILNSYLNAIDGKGVHVITSNDYLAKRDAIQNSQVFNFLGLSCGYVEGQPKMNRNQRKEQYKKDIVYSTASTIGFDYLDDNRVKKKSEKVFNREFNYAIIDEVDSILLDDARV
ncbi:MAG: DEAD/DEAH box helicase, partial [Tenericutes bacterium]|nr:DEAD/DEAH box helicase [Mycoplasmatota bacterium]